MQVILQEDVRNLGKAGEVVSVKDGYGRNYLLPQRKAVIADPGNLKMLEHQKKSIAAQQQKLRTASEAFAKKLESVTVTLMRQAGVAESLEEQKELVVEEAREVAEEKLFGSVTVRDIAESLRALGFTIDRRDIYLEQPIKKLGKYPVNVQLPGSVTATITVEVVKKG